MTHRLMTALHPPSLIGAFSLIYSHTEFINMDVLLTLRASTIMCCKRKEKQGHFRSINSIGPPVQGYELGGESLLTKETIRYDKEPQHLYVS